MKRLLKLVTGQEISPTKHLRLSHSQITRVALRTVYEIGLRTSLIVFGGTILLVEIFEGPREEEAVFALIDCFLCCLCATAMIVALAALREGLRIRSTSFELTPTHLIMSQGRIFKKEHSFPCGRVVEFEMKQDLLANVLSLADVQIATGQGRYSDGIKISGFSFEDAQELEHYLVGSGLAGSRFIGSRNPISETQYTIGG